jgi:beta-galactosidase
MEEPKLGRTGPDQQLPSSVHAQHGVNRLGKQVHYYFNYSGTEVKLKYAYRAGTICSTASRLPALPS